MEILEKNRYHLIQIQEYLILKKYIIENEIMSYKELTNKEIDILLNTVRKERLDDYFKWLFSRNRNQKKIIFLKEASEILKDDIVNAQLSVNLIQFLSKEEVIKRANKYKLNVGGTNIFDEYFIAEMIGNYNENNFRNRYRKFFDKCIDLENKDSDMVDIYFEKVIEMVDINNPKLKKIVNSLKLSNENYEKFKNKRLQKGGSADVKLEPYMDNLFKLEMEDLRYLMEVIGYPIFNEHLTFMKVVIRNTGSNFWNRKNIKKKSLFLSKKEKDILNLYSKLYIKVLNKKLTNKELLNKVGSEIRKNRNIDLDRLLEIIGLIQK